MKPLHYATIAYAALLLAWAPAVATAATAEEKEVRQFIQKMYSYDPAIFEYGKFKGKYQSPKHCDLLRSFFVEKLISAKPITPGGTVSCDIRSAAYVRYPTEHEENLSPDSRYKPLPKVNISTVAVHGTSAKVAVITGGGERWTTGRSLYFLSKTEKGWRISNILLNEKWPEIEEDKCIGTFSLDPTPEENRELMPHCR